jgi:hypothetical protein
MMSWTKSFIRDDVVAGLAKRAGGREDRGADAAADDDRGAELVDVRRPAEGADEVEDRIAAVQGVQLDGGLADALDDDGDRPLSDVGGLDGERDALAMFVKPQDDELAGPLRACDARCLDLELLHVRPEEFRFDDREHEHRLVVIVVKRREESHSGS